MKKCLLAAGIIATIFCSTCAFLEQRLAVKKCKFNLAQVDIRKFSLTGLTLGLRIAILNPNTIEVKVDRMDLDFYIEDIKTIKVTSEPVSVRPKGSEIISAQVVVPYSVLGMSVANDMKARGKISYRLQGSVFVETDSGTISFPITIMQN